MLLATACALTSQSPPETNWNESVAFAGIVRKRWDVRVVPDLELVLGPRREAGQLGAEHLQVGHRVGALLRGDRFPGRRLAGRSEADRRVVGRGRSDPLDRHGRRRVALPGQKERVQCRLGFRIGRRRPGRSLVFPRPGPSNHRGSYPGMRVCRA